MALYSICIAKWQLPTAGKTHDVPQHPKQEASRSKHELNKCSVYTSILADVLIKLAWSGQSVSSDLRPDKETGFESLGLTSDSLCSSGCYEHFIISWWYSLKCNLTSHSLTGDQYGVCVCVSVILCSPHRL